MDQSQAKTKHIYIRNFDLGFWTQQGITVQHFDETSDCCGAAVIGGFCTDCKEHAEPRHELIWCNHAGAIEEVVDQQINNPHGRDIVWESRVLFCDKDNCEAYKPEGQDYWEDAPFEGITAESDRVVLV